MTKIAIISDIHSNLPAFEAVIEDIRSKQIDKIYNLGDLIGKGPSPSEVIDLCMKECDFTVLGNWEDFLLHSNVNENPINFYRKLLRPEHLKYFQSLPYGYEFYFSGKLFRLYHSNPFNIYSRIFSFADLNSFAQMFMYNEHLDCYKEKRLCDVVIYSDIHYTFSIKFNDLYFAYRYKKLKHDFNITEDDFKKDFGSSIKILRDREIYNTGSVGQPFDDNTASYILLEGEMNSKFPAPYSIEFVRVPYDNCRAADFALKSDMLDKMDYINEILTGIYRGL